MELNYKNVKDFLTELERVGIKVWLDSGKLKYKDKNNVITPVVLNTLKKQKREIIEFLKELTFYKGQKDSLHVKPMSENMVEFPLSYNQQRLWFLYQLEKTSVKAYNLTIAIRLKGYLQIDFLEESLNYLVKRHNIFRAVFEEKAGIPYQRFKDFQKFKLEQEYVSKEEINDRIRETANYNFDLSKELLFKFKLFKLSQNEYYLVINQNHIITDGWSIKIILNELSETYNTLIEGSSLKVPQPSLQYTDFVLWQKKRINDGELDSQKNYWTEKLKGYKNTDFPTSNPRPVIKTYNGKSFIFKIEDKITEKIYNQCKNTNSTLFIYLLCVYNILFQKYTNQKEILLGTGIANRNIEEFEKIPGFFVNTVVLRNKIRANKNFIENLENIKLNCIEAFKNQDLPFEQVVDSLNLKRDINRAPLIQHMFMLQNSHNTANLTLKNIDAEFVDINTTISKFDFSIYIKEYNNSLQCCIDYNTDLFRPESIKAFAEHFENLIIEVLNSPLLPLQELTLLSDTEYKDHLYKYNITETDYPHDKLLHELFEDQALSTPYNTAVEFSGKTLNYLEVSHASNRLANFITEYYEKMNIAPGPCSFIGIYLDRGTDFVISVLGILKTGSAYVPLDTGDPESRLKYKIENSELKLIITSSSLSGRLSELSSEIKVFCLDSPKSDLKSYSSSFPLVRKSSTSPAYMIYTSGTTGHPKGVIIEHRNIVNYTNWIIKTCNLNESDRSAFLLSPVWDGGLTVFYPSLLSGGSLCIGDEYLFSDPSELIRYLSSNRITFTKLTPSLFRHIAAHSENFRFNRSYLKHVILGGEALNINDIEKFHAVSPDTVFMNHYGPTETTVGVVYHLIDFNNIDIYRARSIIGKPIFNAKAYVLDKKLNPVPYNVEGELYIGGACVGKGYQNMPELTTERFIQSPFEKSINNSQPSRLYRTGDRVRRLSDGNLEFLGRNDRQIKIRGYRIELPEIETAAMQHPAITGCTSIFRNIRDNESTILYYTADSDITPGEIKTYLSQELPAYMLPEYFIRLDSFPVNSSGKVDTSRLPEPTAESLAVDDSSIPRTELEQKFHKIWCDILELESVGVNCSFFDAGGNSFKIIKLHRQIESSLGIKIKVVDLFTYPTISGLAEFISPNKEDKAHAVRKTTSSAKCSDIAIIGFSGAFSGSSDIDEYWEKIISGEDCITRLDLESCRNRGISEDIISNPDYIPARGEISQTDKFDPYFFGFSPMDAKFLDPQIRLFVMHCWKALEQSGYIRERNRLSIGLFTGAGANSYLHDNLLRNSDITENYSLWDMMSYGDRKYIASRTAYLLGLKGPVFCLNTACSTSLVSITEACTHLINNRCDLAIAGGCTLHTPENFGYIYSQGTILSPDGRCRAFDKDAAGIVGGSGVGSLVLKRFTDAERDKDNIIAVIKGYSINNDGSRKVGFTAPSVTGQKECIIEAQHMAGITSERIGYIECHGTGTELGDPIELESLKKVFSENSTGITRSDKCYLGSVKANIGHTDTAAGIAGVIKVCRMLQNKLIPPQINYSSPNPKLELESSPFEISKNIIDWKASDNSPLMAGISSFGIGGTNAHIILQEAPQTKKEKPNKAEDIRINLLCMSAKTEKALNNYKKKLLEYLSSKPDLNISDAAYTLRTAREKFDKRKTVAVCGNDFENSIVSSATAHSDKGSNTAFMFPGQGSQYLYMMHDLYKASGVFKDVLDECAEFLIRDGFCDIRKILYPEAGKQKEAEVLLNNTLYTQPILFSVELALASLWISLGIKPSIMIGHSLGEYTAACIAGIFSTENALKIIKKRAELISSLEEGNMLAVGINSCCAEKYTESHISLAAVNAPKLCVFAGQKDNINTLYTRFAEDNIFCKKINTSHAFHSFMMDQILDEFREFISNIKLNKPSIPFISNISGNQITGEEAVSPDYWTDHIRKTVNFYKGADKLINEDKYILLEVGPGRTLSTLINMNESAADKTIIQSLPEKDKNSTLMFYSAVGNMWCLGVEADFEKLDNQQDKFIIPLPTYEFDLKSYWIKPDTDKQNNIQNQKRNSTNKWFYAPAWKKTNQNIRTKTIPSANLIVFINNISETKYFDSSLRETHFFVLPAKKYYFDREKNIFNIRSGSKEDIYRLIDNLHKSNISFENIIYLWNINNTIKSENKAYYSFYNILFLIQKISSKYPEKSISLLVASDCMNSITGCENIIPQNALTIGLLKCIPHEYPNINYKIIDIDLDKYKKEKILEIVLNEHYDTEKNNTVVGYRNGYRWFETYEPVELEESPDINNTSFKHGGVYLITGGLSGIGYETAKFLASTYNAVLILTGRTKLPQKDLWDSPDVLTDKHILERIERIKKLEELGAECCIISADISLEKSVKELYEKSITKYKHIDGVIHCAGIPAGQAMFLKQPEDCEPVFAAKVYGTPLLYKYFAGTKPDFFIVCSSMTAITGGYGQSDYAAANSFIDAFANCIKNKNPEENIISINWSLWKETGMGINTLLPNNMQKEQNERLKTAITNSEGIEAFNKIADTKGIPQILVSPFNIESKNNTETDKKENSNIEISDQTDDNFFERPDIDSEYDPPQDHEEKILVRIWENVLGIKGIGINDNFFKLGGHSLNVTQVISRLNREFNINCSLTVIFENNTVKELAEYIRIVIEANNNIDLEDDGNEL